MSDLPDIVARLDGLGQSLAAIRTDLAALIPPPTGGAWDAKAAKVIAGSPLPAVVAAEAAKAALCSMTVAVADSAPTDPLLQTVALPGATLGVVDPQIRVPVGTKAGCSEDHHLAVRGTRFHGMWHAAPGATSIAYGGGTSMALGLMNEPRPGNSNMSRFRLDNWLITPDDIRRKLIDHPLVFCFPIGIADRAHGPGVYPADTDFCGPVMKYGQWLRLAADADLSGLLVNSLEWLIAKALQIHGMLLRDVGSTFSFFGVDAINQGGNAAVWGGLGVSLPIATGGYPYARKLAGIPWSRLEALQPPVQA